MLTFTELLICEEEVNALRRECETILEEMEDKSMLKQWVSASWEYVRYQKYKYRVVTFPQDT